MPAFFVMREAAKRTEDGGRILTILTSLLAAFTPMYSVYAGSKAPVEHFTRALSKELQDRSISVNALAPGPMDTSFFWDAAHPGEADFVQSQAMRNQLTQVDDIVPWVRFLLTDGWWLNGQTVSRRLHHPLMADEGATIRHPGQRQALAPVLSAMATRSATTQGDLRQARRNEPARADRQALPRARAAGDALHRVLRSLRVHGAIKTAIIG
jgi:Enoyl-(Acyl carrier protein) reductase